MLIKSFLIHHISRKKQTRLNLFLSGSNLNVREMINVVWWHHNWRITLLIGLGGTVPYFGEPELATLFTQQYTVTVMIFGLNLPFQQSLRHTDYCDLTRYSSLVWCIKKDLVHLEVHQDCSNLKWEIFNMLDCLVPISQHAWHSPEEKQTLFCFSYFKFSPQNIAIASFHVWSREV